MDKLNTHLRIVGETQDTGFDLGDIDNLDTEKLRDNMVRGIYMLEAALFSQATYEYRRIEKLRKTISTLEEQLLDSANREHLHIEDKMKLYSVLSGMMNRSFHFLQQLHQNVATGIETVNRIDAMKRTPKTLSDETSKDTSVEEIKALIREKIKERIEQR